MPINWQKGGGFWSEGGAGDTLFSGRTGDGGGAVHVTIKKVGYDLSVEISEENLARAMTIGGLRVTPCAIGGSDSGAFLTYVLDDVDGTRYVVMIDGVAALIRQHMDCIGTFLASMRSEQGAGRGK
ncbi:MAG: hypothetical protein HY812_03565 [Planctomycetes bacterium]|nr:hypothetical protein [Planctomycetota bacterium]